MMIFTLHWSIQNYDGNKLRTLVINKKEQNVILHSYTHANIVHSNTCSHQLQKRPRACIPNCHTIEITILLRSTNFQRTHCGAIITSLLRQSDAATSFGRNNDVIIVPSVCWETDNTEQITKWKHIRNPIYVHGIVHRSRKFPGKPVEHVHTSEV